MGFLCSLEKNGVGQAFAGQKNTWETPNLLGQQDAYDPGFVGLMGLVRVSFELPHDFPIQKSTVNTPLPKFLFTALSP